MKQGHVLIGFVILYLPLCLYGIYKFSVYNDQSAEILQRSHQLNEYKEKETLHLKELINEYKKKETLHLKELNEYKKKETLHLKKQQMELPTAKIKSLRGNADEEKTEALLADFIKWSTKDWTTHTKHKVDTEIVLDPKRMEECAKIRFDPKVDKIDIVYPWINMSESGYYDWPPRWDESTRGRVFKGVGHDRHPYSEIVFSLRSLVKWGMLDYIGNIYIVYNDARHGPPQFLKPKQTRIRPVPYSEILSGTKFIDRINRMQVAHAYFHHIHGLRQHFLFIADDIVMIEPFDIGRFFTSDGKQILHLPNQMHSYPQKYGFGVLQKKFGSRNRRTDGHMPNMMQKCLLEEIEAEFADELFTCDPNLPPPLCNFEKYHMESFYPNYAIDRKAGAIDMGSRGWGKELHVTTNDLKLKQKVHRSAKGTQFFNLQGEGLGEEYTKSDINRKLADEWYFETYPEPGPWEKPNWFGLQDS